MRKPFVISGNISEDLFECPNSFLHPPKPAYILSREEVSELLRRIPSFTDREPPVQDIGTFFPAMQGILIEMDENSNQSFMARVPYGTPDTVIARIIHMKDYTAFETTEMVSHSFLFHLWFFSFFL